MLVTEENEKHFVSFVSMLITHWAWNFKSVQTDPKDFLVLGTVLHKVEISFSNGDQYRDKSDKNISHFPVWLAQGPGSKVTFRQRTNTVLLTVVDTGILKGGFHYNIVCKARTDFWSHAHFLLKYTHFHSFCPSPTCQLRGFHLVYHQYF